MEINDSWRIAPDGGIWATQQDFSAEFSATCTGQRTGMAEENPGICSMPAYQKLSPAERAALSRHVRAYSLTQFRSGEQQAPIDAPDEPAGSEARGQRERCAAVGRGIAGDTNAVVEHNLEGRRPGGDAQADARAKIGAPDLPVGIL